ncbi:MAG: ATP-binding protein [Betaproteobacteria bacterium]|nr:ATP-binding protein [Betaproteobacteria bacterium]
MNDWDKLYMRAESLLSRLERLLPAQQPDTGWNTAVAFRWRKHGRTAGFIQPVAHPHHITLDALRGIDAPKKLIDQNTYQFVQGYPANNVLLTGARGTGKSSLVKAMLTKYAESGLRLIEVEKHDLTDLHDIVEQICRRPERFILYCDDLSFESGEPGYKALKVVLDGSIATASENVLVYATSNRRHLMPEFMQENRETRHIGEEIHPGEAIEEKISLSERFGLWVSFYPFDQDQYLEAARQWLAHYGIPEMTPPIREAALRWALGRGSRSGRVAWQFARDWAGKEEARQI